jgi:hypothetical protein
LNLLAALMVKHLSGSATGNCSFCRTYKAASSSSSQLRASLLRLCLPKTPHRGILRYPAGPENTLASLIHGASLESAEFASHSGVSLTKRAVKYPVKILVEEVGVLHLAAEVRPPVVNRILQRLIVRLHRLAELLERFFDLLAFRRTRLQTSDVHQHLRPGKIEHRHRRIRCSIWLGLLMSVKTTLSPTDVIPCPSVPMAGGPVLGAAGVGVAGAGVGAVTLTVTPLVEAVLGVLEAGAAGPVLGACSAIGTVAFGSGVVSRLAMTFPTSWLWSDGGRYRTRTYDLVRVKHAL